VLFLVISLGLALLNRTPGASGVEAAGAELSNEAATSNWLETELNPQIQDEYDFQDDIWYQDEAVLQDEAVPEGE